MSMYGKYLEIVKWARNRYAKNGWLVLERGGKPSKYSRIEKAAWKKYLFKRHVVLEHSFPAGTFGVYAETRSGVVADASPNFNSREEAEEYLSEGKGGYE